MEPAATIRFDDGAAYEGFMGGWSRLAGDAFLDWLAPAPGLGWLDVGCGNGAFTEMLAQRSAPSRLQGIDPSDGQLAFARTRAASGGAAFDRGDAMALPYPDATFDAAVMALVIFFVPEPARGVAEMVRVVRPGGSVSAYAWDIPGGGFPYVAIHEALAAIGVPPNLPPRADASRAEALQALWTGAGLDSVETRRIDIERRFESFDDFWQLARSGPGTAPSLAALDRGAGEALKAEVRRRLGASDAGPFSCRAHAHAVKGRVAG